MNFSTSSAVFAWRPAAWLRVSGADAASFLQGQFTNELRGLAVGGAVYGLWLTLKGKVLADSFVVRGAEEFWIGSYHSPASVIRERLEAFVIADDVTIEDATAEWAGISVWGDGEETAVVEWARGVSGGKSAGVAFRGRRGRQENMEWIFPVTAAGAVRERLAGRRELDVDEVTRRRIAAGIPAVPADIGPGDLPGEGALEAAAISYTKGCYLGQEVIARLKSMGQVRRRLLRVAGAGEMPTVLPAALFAGERKVGEVRSAVGDGVGGWAGLAMLSLMHVAVDATLAWTAGGVASVRLKETP